MGKRINVVFIIPSLRAGGAERVMSYISMHLNKEEFASQLLVIGSKEDQAYEIKGIPVKFLNKRRVRDGVFDIAKFLNVNKIDIAVSAMSHVNTVMAFLGIFFRKTKFVGRETIVKSQRHNYQGHEKKRTWHTKLLSKYLDKIICQSDDMKIDMIKNYDYPSDKIVVINNPVRNEFKLKMSRSNKKKELITIGRLSKQKGYLRILEALRHVSIPYHYTIIGEGKERESIQQYIKDNKMENSISHIPFSNKIAEYLSNSDLYLQGSYVEGFPNALLESCAVGTPAVVFKALGGINEILVEGVNGYIANDADDFLKKLNIAFQTEWDASIVRDSVVSKYSQEIILQNYEKLFKELAE